MRVFAGTWRTHDLVGCAGTSCLIDSNWIYAGDPFVHGIVAYPAERCVAGQAV